MNKDVKHQQSVTNMNAVRPAKRVQLPSAEEVLAERERLQNRKRTDVKPKRSEQKPKRKQKKEKERVSIPSSESVIKERDHLHYKARFRRILTSTIGILLVVAAVAALTATLFLSVLQVSGSSMEPALNDGDVIVLFKNAEFETGDLVGLYYNGKIMLKRIIGQAGDYINIDSAGDVYVNGVYLDEPYVTGKSLGDCDLKFPYQVPDSTCFVLGDHRSISMDSRNSAIGCIRTEQIIGKIVVRIWPLPDITIIR